jgi:oligoendopeptidase F
MRTTYCRTRLMVILAAFVLLGLALTARAQDVKERSQIAEKYTWDLTAMYKTDADWEADVKALEGMIPNLKSFEGKISKSPDDLLAFFKAMEDASKKLDNAYTYASIKSDQDTRDQKYKGMDERMGDVASKFGEALAWSTPEMVSVPDSVYARWYKQKPELAIYKHSIDNNLRTKKYTLSPAEERILALSGNLSGCPSNTAGALRNADLKFPKIKDEKGNEVEISEGRMAMLLESPDKNVRRDASMTLLRTYGEYKNTLAAAMSGNIQKDIFYARSRGYNSSLQSSLDNDNVDTTVFLNLIETVKKNAGTLQKYVDLRRRALGLDSIHLYDMFAPLIPETRQNVEYEDAVKTIEVAMAPLGKDYVTDMTKGFNSRWVDVYENKGKRSGAYSTGTVLSHPYMLLNYNNTLDDEFTTAHEMGHSMNRLLSNRAQPYVYSDNPIFLAEIASTFNEALLMDHLLKNEKDAKKKLYLLNQYIDQVRGTLFTQVLFADFELRMHRAAEAGQPLTAETLGNMYRETLKDYYGNSVVIDPEYGFTWSRIPHFYRNFYVYKYATSFAASQALSQSVLTSKGKDKELARQRYINFLSAGGAKYPIETLKDAGVDLTTPVPVDATMKKFSAAVDQMEKLLKETKTIK